MPASQQPMSVLIYRKQVLMTNCPPPYRPLRGAEPPHFVDRPHDEIFGAATMSSATIAALACGPSDPRFHQLVTSAPAMGKTAFLRAIGRLAATRLDWAVAFHHCRPKQRAIGTVITEVMACMQRQWPGRVGALASEVMMARLDGLGARWRDRQAAECGPAPVPCVLPMGAEVSWTELKHLLERSGRFAQGISRGLVVMFDDADLLGGGEVESLGHLARCLSRDGLPVSLVFSGGEALAERFSRVGNFSGTVWPTQLGWFDDAESREALVVPAIDRAVEFEDRALELVCGAAGGSPLVLQRLGFAAWSAARGSGRVAVPDVEEAMAQVGFELASEAS